MTAMTLTDEQMAAVSAALLDPSHILSAGLTGDDGERCTIAEINFALTGTVSDDLHPCMSDVIRRWVIRVQDAMPSEVRNSPVWRSAAVGIAGSAASADVERRRAQLLLEWMWDALSDEIVVEALPPAVRAPWDRMLVERTHGAAHAAAHAADCAAAHAAYAAADYAAYAHAAYAHAAYVAAAYAHAAEACAYAAVDVGAYWERRDCPGMLRKLIEVSE